MPQPTPVASPPVVTAPVHSIYKTFDEKHTPITLLLKGGNGTRKTTKAVQFPGPCLFNFDNNLSGLRNLDQEMVSRIKIVHPLEDVKTGKPVKDIDVWDNFVKQLEIVSADPAVKTIIIDSLTTLAEKLIDKILKTGDPAVNMQIQHWGDFTRYLKWMGDELLCATDLDKNVIFIAHETEVKDKLVLAIGTKMKDAFGIYFSDIWRCSVKKGTSGPASYNVRVQPAPNFDAKCSLKGLPDEFDWEVEKAKIFSQIVK